MNTIAPAIVAQWSLTEPALYVYSQPIIIGLGCAAMHAYGHSILPRKGSVCISLKNQHICQQLKIYQMRVARLRSCKVAFCPLLLHACLFAQVPEGAIHTALRTRLPRPWGGAFCIWQFHQIRVSRLCSCKVAFCPLLLHACLFAQVPEGAIHTALRTRLPRPWGGAFCIWQFCL